MVDPKQAPFRIHKDEHAIFEWERPLPDLTRSNVGSVLIEYSVDRDGERQILKRTLEFPKMGDSE